MLELKNVYKTFNANTINEKRALNGLNLKLEEGDFVTVIGGNGAGKSTMMNAISRTCLEYTEKYQITFLIGVPTILSMLARMQERTPYDLSSLHGIVTMGAPFEKAACEKYMKLLTPRIFNGYGTTETFWNTFLSPRKSGLH